MLKASDTCQRHSLWELPPDSQQGLCAHPRWAQDHVSVSLLLGKKVKMNVMLSYRRSNEPHPERDCLVLRSLFSSYVLTLYIIVIIINCACLIQTSMCLSLDAIISQTILRQSGNIFKIVIWNLELCLLAMTVRLAEKVANEMHIIICRHNQASRVIIKLPVLHWYTYTHSPSRLISRLSQREDTVREMTNPFFQNQNHWNWGCRKG